MAIGAALLLQGCVTGPGWVSERLYLGRSIPAGGEVGDADWERFVRDDLTPRFPQGLTIWRADGQWGGADGGVTRERVMVIEVVRPRDGPAGSALRDAGRAYGRRFGQEAVLHVSSTAEAQLLR